MGITNTIAKLKAYFDAWHSKAHNFTDADFENLINRVDALYDIWNNNSNNSQLSFLNTIKDIITKFNNLTADINNASYKTIKSLSDQINDLRSKKADKAWTYVQIAADPQLTEIQSWLRYNDSLGIGILYIYLDANDGRAKRPVNKYGYTEWIEFRSVVDKYGGNKFTKYIITENRKPHATYSTYCVNGTNKIRFGPKDNSVYLAASFRDTAAVDDRYGVLDARFILMYSYPPK